MMDAYLENMIAGIFRVLILLFLLFIVLPKFLVGRENSSRGWDNALAGFILTSSFVTIIVLCLSIIRIYDTISLYLGVALFSGIFIITGDFGKHGDFLTRVNYGGLKIIERNVIDWLREIIRDNHQKRNEKQEAYAFIWKIMLTVALIVAGVVRLIPVFRTASPFSIEAYKTLEYVKALGTKNLFYDQMIIPKGLHAIIDVVFQFSRVNPQILVHIFGAVSALMLMLAIYKIVSLTTGNRPSALLAAALFGIFSRLLPVNLEPQVEANSIVLGALFLIISLFFILEFVGSPSLFSGITAFLGMMVSVLTTYFSAVIFALLLPAIALSVISAAKPDGKKTQRRVLGSIILFVSGAALYFAYQKLLADSLLMAAVKSVISDESFTRFAREDMIFSDNIFFILSVSLGAVSVLLFFLLKKNRWRNHYFAWGLMTILLAVFWYGENLGIYIDLNRAQIGFVLSLFVCITLGMVVYGSLFRFIEKRADEEEVIPLRVTVWGLVLVLVFFEIFMFLKAPTIAHFQYQTEPDGYVRAIYEIEKKYDPFDWMIVSHFGDRVQVQKYGRYMDYLYFLKYYNPHGFNEKSKTVIPASQLFVFVEKDKLENHVDTALLPKIPDLNIRLQGWCSQFARENKNIHVFYEDEQVRVYRIDIPKKKKTISDQLKG